MDPKGALILQTKKPVFGKKKDVKVTTQEEVEAPTAEAMDVPYLSMPAYHAELFPQGSPRIQDVSQRQIGNCFLLATLHAMLGLEAGRVFINGLMRDVGPDDKSQPLSDSNPAWVVVRLYALSSATGKVKGTEKYIKVKKHVQVDVRGREVFQSGALWVHMLLAAWAHFNKFGTWQETPSYQNLDGSQPIWAFGMLTGNIGPTKDILDFSNTSERATLKEERAANLAILFNKLKDPAQVGGGDVLTKVFGGNPVTRNAYLEWLNASPKAAWGQKPGPSHRKTLEVLLTRDRKALRREDFQRLFQDNGPNSGTEAVLRWIDEAKLFMRTQRVYTPSDLSVYDFIRGHHTGGNPVCMGTRKQLGSRKNGAVEEGASGESMVKGLVAEHAYSVCGVEKDADGGYWISVRNPWGNYSRTYSDNGRSTANPENGGVSRLTLGDVIKNFSHIHVGQFKFKV